MAFYIKNAQLMQHRPREIAVQQEPFVDMAKFAVF